MIPLLALALVGVVAGVDIGGGSWMLASVDPKPQVRGGQVMRGLGSWDFVDYILLISNLELGSNISYPKENKINLQRCN